MFATRFGNSLPSSRWVFSLAILLGLLFFSVPSAQAQLTSTQRRELTTLRRDISKAGSLIRRKEGEEAKKLLDDAESQLKEIASAAGLDANDRAIGSIQKAIDLQRQQLERVMDGGGNAAKDGGGGVSFSEDVAPILAANCLGCHDDTARGGLRLDTFANIRRGGMSGPLLTPGNPQRSLLAYKLIAPGQQRMPRGGQPLNANEIKTIADWITQGAKYDHDDQTASIMTLEKEMNKPEITVAKPDGTETVSFKEDIAPMFVTFCLGCHSGNNPASGFSMVTFEDILIGGDSGEVLIPGELEDSRLFRLTGGLENPRMPQGQARITRKNYEDLKAWIKEGIKYDVDDPKMRLVDIVPSEEEKMAMKLRSMSDAEMREHRQERVDAHWRRTLSSANPVFASNDNFLVSGNMAQGRVEEVLGWADSTASELKDRFGLAKNPTWKGRLAIYVFKDRYDYDEFNRSIENRQPADTLFGHGRVTTNYDNAYVAVLDTGDISTSQKPALKWTLFKAMASALLQENAAARPNWLIEGAGWALADPDLRSEEFERSMTGSAAKVLGSLRRPEDLFDNGTFAPDATEHVGYVTARFLLTKGSLEQFRRFSKMLLDGRNVNEACQAVYGASSNELAQSVRNAAR